MKLEKIKLENFLKKTRHKKDIFKHRNISKRLNCDFFLLNLPKNKVIDQKFN
jgi:hypothetical protein